MPLVVDISPRGKQAAQCLFGMRNGAHERTVSAARHPLFEHNGGSAEPPKNLECDANPSWSLGSR